MNNKLIIAAAGAGKTTYLVRKALEIVGKVLITTYTESNADEIHRKFFEIAGKIPENVTIQTWWSFLLQHGVKPYQSFLIEKHISGLLLVNKPSGIKYIGKFGPVQYPEEEVENHFFSNSMSIYSDKIAKFVVRINSLSSGSVLSRISQIYPTIFIDEVQDLAGYDLEIIKSLLVGKSKILLVGDPRQVAYITHNERKYNKYSNGGISSFIEKECKKHCNIDTTTLNVSYRNNAAICNFSSILYPHLAPAVSAQQDVSGHDGVFIISPDKVNEYMKQYGPVQLRYNVSTKVLSGYRSYNFGESKGLTFDRVIIYPTGNMLSWLKSDDYMLKDEIRAKFYIALTRAKYSVAIISKERITNDLVTEYESQQ